MGLLVAVVVHAANIQDKVGVRLVLRRVPLFARWQRVIVDAGYDSAANTHWSKDWLGVDYQVQPRTVGKGFTPQPCRWVVERTFAWFGKYRRLGKDYETLPDTAEACLFAAMVHLMTRRLAHS